MSSEFLELPVRARRYIEIANEVSHLEQQAADNPGDDNLYRGAIDTGRITMEILEDDAADAFIGVAVHVEPEDVTYRRSIIESLREQEDFQNGIITEDDIQAQLAQLPPFADYDPETRGFVATYFAKIGELCLADSVEAIVLPPAPTSTPVPGSEPRAGDEPEGGDGGNDNDDGGEGGEDGVKPKLTIRIFKDRVIQVGDNGEFVSMFRDIDVPKTSEEEAFIADARIAALKTITGVSSDERGISSSEVWDTYAGFATYSSSWHANVIEPLADLSFKGMPVVDIWKPKETAKRRYHRNGSFDVNFVEVDERAPYDNREVIALPNGEYLFGLRAKALHLLLRASEEAPFSNDDVITSDLYTAEELREMSRPNASSVISYMRRYIEAIEDFTLQSVYTEGRNMGYWVEYTGNDKGLYPFLYEDEFRDHPARVGTTESLSEHEKSLVQSASVANWLIENKHLLAARNLPQMEESQALAIIAQAQHAGVEPFESDSFDLRMAIAEMLIVLSDDGAIEAVIEKIPAGDPRWKLVDYLTDVTGTKSNIEKLVAEFADLDLQLDLDLLHLNNTIEGWANLDNTQRVEGIKYSYDLFNRIGESIKAKEGLSAVGFDAIMQAAQKRITQVKFKGSSTPGFRFSTQQILTDTYLRWADGMPNRSNRELRRLWASELRAKLNQKTSTR